MVLGNLFQLEPVNAAPPYVRLLAKQMNRFVGGVPCSPDLWKSFVYEELTINHRQQGDENIKWKEVLSKVRFGMLEVNDIQYLRERLIDVSMCTTNKQYLETFVGEYLKCEAQGINPVCLVPKRSMCEEYNDAIMAHKGERPIIILANDRFWFSKQKKNYCRKEVYTNG